MKLELVPFEIAQAIKSKGFDWKCHSVMFNKISNYTQQCDSKHNHNKFDDRVSMPEIDLVVKWLREVHKIDIDVLSMSRKDDSREYRCIIKQYFKPSYISRYSGDWVIKHEQAQIAGIKEALKLIKTK